MMTLKAARRSGFTFIELMGVLLIISVLVALLLPAVQQARESARRTQCRNNLYQLGLALANYQMTHGVLPPGCVSRPGYEGQIEAAIQVSWAAQILPFFEQKGIHQQINFERPEWSFLTAEELERYVKAMQIWSELQTLDAKTYPLSPDSEGSSVNPSENSANLSPQDPTAAENTSVPADSIATESTSSDEPASTSETRQAARRLELELQLQELGYSATDKMLKLPFMDSTQGTGAVEIDQFQCPSRANTSMSYAGNHNSLNTALSETADGLLYVNSSESLRAIPDGAAVTILAGEFLTSTTATETWFLGGPSTLRNGGAMANPQDQYRANSGGLVADFSGASPDLQDQWVAQKAAPLGAFGSPHSFSLVNFLFADGSVKGLPASIDVTTFRQMMNRNDGF